MKNDLNTSDKWNIQDGVYLRNPEHTNSYLEQKKKKELGIMIIKIGGVILAAIFLAIILFFFVENL